MSQKFLKKEQAVINLRGSAPRINFLKEKLTALLLFVFLVFVVYKCSKNAGVNKVTTNTSQEPKKQVLRTDVGDKKVNGPRIIKKKDPVKVVDTAMVGFTPVDGKTNAGDTKPDNNSNYNNQNQYEEEAISIQINLEMTKQNEFRWNPEIQKYASRIMIVFETGSQEGSLTADVTGTSYYKFHSGNPKFDGVKTRVTLKITPKGKVQFNGQNSIKVKTTC